MKHFCFALITILLCMPAAHAASNPSPTTDAYEYFKLGELHFIAGHWYCLAEAGDNVKNVLQEHRERLLKMKVSIQTIAAFDQYTASFKNLPFTKPWNKWTPDEQNQWIRGRQLWSPFDEAFYASVQENFFVWIGFETFRFDWSIPTDLLHGATLITETTEIHDGILDMEDLTKKSDFALTTPEVQQAMKTIVSMKSKVDGSHPGSLSQADVAAMQEAGRAIRDAVQKGTFLNQRDTETQSQSTESQTSN